MQSQLRPGISLLLGLLLCLCAASFTQQPTQPTRTEILIPVVVADSSGAVVSGLQAGDFSLKIGHNQVAPDKTEEVAPLILPPDKGGKQGLPIFLILDKLSVLPPDVGSVQQSIFRFLEQTAETGERVALMTIDADGLKLVHNYSTPTPALTAALELFDQKTHALGGHYRSPTGVPVSDELKTRVADELNALQEMVAQGKPISALNASTVQIEALQRFGYVCRRMQGRKLGFWIVRSAFLRFDSSEQNISFLNLRQSCSELCTVHFENAIESLNEARTSIYPVALPPPGLVDLNAGNDDAEASLTQIARDTGGELVRFDPDLGKQIRLGLSHFASYYLISHHLGPAPEHIAWTKLEVRTKRADAHVRFPEGFFELP